MRSLPEVPALLTRIESAIRAAGGRTFLVGGCVRDHLLGRALKDWDVEAYGLDEDELYRVLKTVGRVDAVGKSFGVFKLGQGGEEIDVSLPRRDSNSGPGHKGIRVEGDPHMSITEAARRRDLTINAILVDLHTHELIDPFNGQADVEAGVLRAVDADTFLEDPLRALRAVQFAARLDFEADPTLIELCRQAALDELPAERIQEEWRKLMLRGTKPSRGMALARTSDILSRVFPEVTDHADIDDLLDQAVGTRTTIAGEGRRFAYMLAVWLHRCDAATIEATLDRLWLHKWQGYALRDQVTAAVAHRLDPITTDAELRWLSTRAETELTLLLRAVTDDRGLAHQALSRAHELGIEHVAPEPILKGRHLKGHMPPGPQMGMVLKRAYEAQLDGRIITVEEALALIRAASGSAEAD